MKARKLPKLISCNNSISLIKNDSSEISQLQQKFEFFNNTKVKSCIYVKKQFTKDPIAVPFYQQNPIQLRQSYLKSKESKYLQSIVKEQMQQKLISHAGAHKKPLEKYNPNSMRSRLPQNSLNVSQIKYSSNINLGKIQQIKGDNSLNKPLTNQSTYKTHFQFQKEYSRFTQNSGINSFLSKKVHKRLNFL